MKSFSPFPSGRGAGGVGSGDAAKGAGGGNSRPPVPHLITRQKVDPDKVAFARQLRREPTPEEELLWEELRASRLRGLHFRIQQIIHGFIADFYCHAAGVVVEVDGGIHDQQVEYDAARNLAFTTLGLFVLRFRNEEVNGGMPVVLERITTGCAQRITVQSAPEEVSRLT